MKKLALFMIMALGLAATACGRENVTHDSSVLPEKARTTLSQNFTSAVTLVEIEKDMGSVKEYEVTLANGSEVTFDGAGEWTSIDTPANVAVPSGLVPTAIANYVKTKHAGALIVGIEKERKGYEVELNNGLDINFDLQGNFVSYDK